VGPVGAGELGAGEADGVADITCEGDADGVTAGRPACEGDSDGVGPLGAGLPCCDGEGDGDGDGVARNAWTTTSAWCTTGPAVMNSGNPAYLPRTRMRPLARSATRSCQKLPGTAPALVVKNNLDPSGVITDDPIVLNEPKREPFATSRLR